MAAMFAYWLAAGAWMLVGVIGIGGAMLLAAHRQVGGLQTLGVAGALVVGLVVGQATGSEWRYPVEMSAHVEMELGPPVSETYSGDGICRTIDNGDLIDAVQANGIVRVGTDQLSLFVWPSELQGAGDRMMLVAHRTEGRLAWYQMGPGTQLDIETDALGTAGNGTFTDLEAEDRGEPLGGPGGPRLLDGTFSWTCEDSP